MRRLTRFTGLLLLCLGLLSTAYAQKKPKENAAVSVAFRYTGMNVPTTSLLGFSLWEVGQSPVYNNNLYGAGTGGTLTASTPHYVLMTPGRHFQATLSSGAWDYGEVKFSPPPGYSIWINDYPVSTTRVLGNPFLIYKIELRADNDAGYLPAGEAAMPHIGDLIWGVSAGRYSTGLSAGSVQWRTDSLSTDLLNATSLSYLPPNTGEVVTTWHSDGGLLEVRTYQFVLYVRRNTTVGTGYDIEIYSPGSAHTGSGDGPYTYDSSDWLRTFRISNPDGSTWNNRIKIEKIDPDQTLTWTMAQSGSNWTVTEGSALRTTTLTSTTSGGTRTETVLVQDNGSATATKLQRKFQNFGWGQEEMTEQTANPDAANGPALTTTYAYNTTSGSGGYGRLDAVTNPDGSWSRYVYDDTVAGFGNLTAIYQPWQDSPSTASSATSSNCQTTLFSYVGERNVFLDQPAGTEMKISGTTTAKNTISYSYPGNAPNGEPVRTDTVQTYTASGSTLTTTRKIYNPSAASPNFLGRNYSLTNPDGTKVSFLRYQAYWWNYGDSNSTNLHLTTPGYNNTWGEYHFNGFSTAVADSVAVSSWDGQSFETVYMVPNRSTVDLEVYDDQGRVQDHVHYVFTGASGGVASFEFLGLEEDGYASNGRLGTHTALNGLREAYGWIYNRLSGTTTNDGIYTEHTPDAVGRPKLSRKWNLAASGEYPAQGYIATHRTFDASDRVLTEKVSSDTNPANNPADAVTTTRVYNLAGLLTSETAESTAGAFQTTYAYSNGGRTVTTTLPGGATKVTDTYLDGTPKSVTGTGVVAQYSTASVNTDGTVTRQTTAASSSGSRWTKVTTDWVGRKVKEEHPTTSSGTTFTKQYFYNSTGRLIKTTENGLADTLISYNAWQQPYRTGLDLNGNGTLDPASLDRITETDTVFEKNSGTGAWWSKTTTQSYNQDSNGTPVTTGVTKTRLNKFDDNGIHFGSYIQSETLTTDVFGNVTDKTVAVQRGTSYFATDVRLVTETTTYPDSSTPEVKVTRNGLVQKQQSKQGLVTRLYYDGRGRLVKQTDPRTDTSTTARTGYVTNSDRVSWRQDSAGNQTNYAYDSSTGQLFSETNPLSKATYHGYDYAGREVRTWGAATYPVEYAFDDYGAKTAMRTFRTSTDFTTSTWPLSDDSDPKKPDGSAWTSGDKTTWTYDTPTGLLTTKTDASSHSVGYTYNARGQLATRTWSRGTVTTYAYSSTTAEQTGITYSDSTPALSYTYNRLGQSATTGDVTGTRTFAYSATTTQLSSETLPSFFGSRVLSRAYDTTTTGALGRSTGFALSGASGSGTDYSVAYGYDAYGRFNALTSGSGPAYTYAYTANSNLIASIADTASGWTETMAYNASRDLLDSVDGQFSTAHKATFAYTYDNLGRRTARTVSGEIFDRYDNSGLTTNWAYDDKSQVTSEQSVFAGTSTAVAGRSDAFAYDAIGNRATATRNGHTATYTANSLNQYTSRDVPGYIGVSGLAPASGTVTVNGSASGVTQQGDYYFKDFSVTNSSSLWSTFTIASSLGGSFTRTAFIPATPESMSYDLDGNLTSDGRWDYTWDAENRLIAMQTHTALSPSVIANADARRLEFTYDYLGRRVEKLVRSGYNGSSYTAVTLDRKFIYDGWNLISERNASTLAAVNSFVWGLDLTGTLQDGGGVGGLLAVIDATNSAIHQPYYDGNGNVHALVNHSGGAVTAAYEYSAFGETLRATGSFAQGNPFRFSSKYTDDETALLQFNRRYYDPRNGRFLGRDPIEEKGGLHLYAFVRNNPINSWDYLGMILQADGQAGWSTGSVISGDDGGTGLPGVSWGGVISAGAQQGTDAVNDGFNSSVAGQTITISVSTSVSVGSLSSPSASSSFDNSGGFDPSSLSGGVASRGNGVGYSSIGTTSSGLTQAPSSTATGATIGSGPNTSAHLPSEVASGQTTTLNSSGQMVQSNGAPLQMMPFKVNENTTPTNNNPDFATVANGFSQYRGAFNLAANAGDVVANVSVAAISGGLGYTAEAFYARGTGLLNSNNYVRIGWGWKGSATNGSNVFRIVIGNKDSWIHWHFP